MVKYGVPSAEWIRKLGKRMLKFDFKGYSKAKANVAYDDWAGSRSASARATRTGRRFVKAALGEIGYDGWATAEVGGGNEEYLKKISATMDKILGL